MTVLTPLPDESSSDGGARHRSLSEGVGASASSTHPVGMAVFRLQDKPSEYSIPTLHGPSAVDRSRADTPSGEAVSVVSLDVAVRLE